LNAPQVAIVRSRDEIAEAILAFTPADWARLRLVAKKYAYCQAMSDEDLLHEAVYRALKEKGGRKCPTHIGVVKFFAETMRSIANGEFEKSDQVEFVAIANHGDQIVEQVDPPDSSLNPEEALIAKQEEAAILRAALIPFEDDQAARDIIEGTLAGLNGQELRELIGLDQIAYDSKRKLVRRRIDNSHKKDGSYDHKK
jgi:ADP-ribose pyrophosphatase YjhB (NUDIX family)